MIKGICKYCGQEKELIKSHIIPKCMYRLKETGPLIGINDLNYTIDTNPIHQNGIKEPLMCKECDNIIGKLDNYVFGIFNQILEKYQIEKEQNILSTFPVSDKFDYWKFKKFFISVVWRLSVSSSRFTLGPYEDIALKMLKDEIHDNPDLFLSLVYHMDTQSKMDKISICYGNKTNGKRIYGFHIPYFSFMVIPNTEHSNNPEKMNMLKSLFRPNNIMIQRVNEIPIYEKQFEEILIKCYKNKKK